MRSSSSFVLVRPTLAASLLASSLASLGLGCPPPIAGWSAPFEGASAPALNNTVTTMSTWDPDGAGPLAPRLILGGTFTNAGGTPVASVAQWNGSAWGTLGTGVTSSGFPQVALSWDPDGPGPALPQLAMGGFYTTLGGVTVRNIGHWDGTAWAGFGSGTQDISGLPDVYAATMWDPDGVGPLPEQLIIGGDFTVAGGASRRRIARWDGATWQALGSGMTDSVYALTTWDPDGSGPAPTLLIAAGFFPSAGGVACNRIAKWDGVSWQPLGAGLDGTVEAVNTFDPDGSGPLPPVLVAGGTFLTSGGTTVNRVAQWNGTSWQPMGAGFNENRVFCFTTFDFDGSGPSPARLVAGGAFLTSGSTALNRIAWWDGSAWQPFGSGMNNSIFELTTWDPDGNGPQAPGLVAGGSFTTAGSLTANRIAFWSAVSACVADTDDGTGTGTCDGGVTIDDLLYYLRIFEDGSIASDVDNGTFTGTPDGGVTIDDLLYYLFRFEAGC